MMTSLWRVVRLLLMLMQLSSKSNIVQAMLTSQVHTYDYF